MITGLIYRRLQLEHEMDERFGFNSEMDGLATDRAFAAHNRYADAYNNRTADEWYELPWRELMLINLAYVNIDRVLINEFERMLAGDIQDGDNHNL